jgi:SAM-dependent methyltransferase
LRESLSQIQAFWDETPCDGQASYAARAQFRYAKDPYLPGILERIAAEHRHILEIGCGQGTDGVTLCQLLARDRRYHGVDLSKVSLISAQQAASEIGDRLKVHPTFEVANAERLPFQDRTFDCVLSVGALHHTPDTARALEEVRRVLVPGGAAYVILYRTWSPKLVVAHALRGLQRCIDVPLRSERLLYRASRALRPLEHRLGTALYECLGVPIFRSYTRHAVEALFQDYTQTRIDAYGPPPLPLITRGRSHALGYVWLIHAVK